MAAEAWTLDGVSLTGTNFTLLELNIDPPKARSEFIGAADSEGQALMRRPLHENRTVTMKLRVTSQASMNAALDQVGVIADKLRAASATSDGIALTWTPASSTRTVTFDVIHGEIPELPVGLDGTSYSWFQQRPVFTVEMTCKPYWRGAEATTSSTSAATPLATIEVANVPGDIPALGRLIVTDNATQIRRSVEWGLENQFYTSGAPSGLTIDSDGMTVTGFSGSQTTRSGAYDPNATGNNVIRGTLVQSPSVICGTGNQTHVGTFKVKARVFYATNGVLSAAAARVALRWQTLGGSWAQNPYAIPIMNAWSDIDLGFITIPPASVGTQQWAGAVASYSSNSGDTVDIDYLILIPAAEGYGRAGVGMVGYRQQGIVGYDEFATGPGSGSPLNARVATLGGTWATSGDTTDLTGNVGGGSVQRATASDAGQGRIALLGATSYTNVSSLVIAQAQQSATYSGPVARYVDASNYLYVEVDWGFYTLAVYKRVAGTNTLLNIVSLPARNQIYSIEMVVYTTGIIRATVYDPFAGYTVINGLQTFDTVAATGGALATGQAGFKDRSAAGVAISRGYEAYYIISPEPEPVVINSGRSMQVQSDRTVMLDSTGAFTGNVPTYKGSRFLVPPGTSRVAVKARRQDTTFGQDDPVTDSTTVQVAYTPRGLVVPR